MLGKTVINKENTSRIYLIWQVHLKVPSSGQKFTSDVDAIFKQNKVQVIETLEEYISNLTQFKDLLIKEDYNAILKKWKVNRIKEILSMNECKKSNSIQTKLRTKEQHKKK
jgi:prephenate dehydrogenase